MTTSITRRQNLSRWRRTKARTTDPETSHAAVARVTAVSLNHKQEAVLTALRRLGGRACDADLVDQYLHEMTDLPTQSPSGIRTRRSELVEQGKVRDIGMRVTLPSGREAIVWTIVIAHDTNNS